LLCHAELGFVPCDLLPSRLIGTRVAHEAATLNRPLKSRTRIGIHPNSAIKAARCR
jgi:hypothetical protein